MSNRLTPFNVRIIPGWIYRSILRNKLNIVDVVCYSRMRQVMSLEDMAEWVYLNESFRIKGKLITTGSPDTPSFSNIFENLSPSERAELNNSVLPLSGTDEIASSAAAKLNTGRPMDESTYKFVLTGDTLYVILNEGFIVTSNEESSCKEFVRNYLKECYSCMSIHDVSKLNVFGLYIKQLNS